MKTNDWFVAYTYSRAEKKTHHCIQRNGFESYLPLQKVKRQWSDRTTLVETPLFPCYLFVKTSQEQIPQLLRMDGIAWFLSFDNKYATVKDQEIKMIQKVLNDGLNIKVEKRKFSHGQRVLVNAGPFNGFTGILLQEQGQRRFILELEGLDQNLSVEIPLHQIEPFKA